MNWLGCNLGQPAIPQPETQQTVFWYPKTVEIGSRAAVAYTSTMAVLLSA